MTLKTFFSGGQLIRSAEFRADAQFLQQAWDNSATRFVAIWQSRCMVAANQLVLLSREELGGESQLLDSIYLGQQDNRDIFVIGLADELHPDGPQEHSFNNFRALMGTFSEADAALLAYAKGMVEWRSRHLFCGVCGAPHTPTSGGFVMECSANNCDTRCFPRLDPAIIVLVIHAEKCLLGRQVGWPDGRYSTLAGFVEPGESLEDAVAREVFEESNIRISTARYLGSQPWPFPNAIMLGFHADAESMDIKLNDGELADARWLSRDELINGDITVPPPQSIAFRLIERWFNEWDGKPLQSFNISSDFRRND
jgi:NAD+ diphosphatase